jgi:hypothetical protein
MRAKTTSGLGVSSWVRGVQEKSSADGSLCHLTDVCETFSQVCSDGVDFPSEPECYIFVRNSRCSEGYGCCHSVGVRNELLDVDTEIVPRVRVSLNAGVAHDICDVLANDKAVSPS